MVVLGLGRRAGESCGVRSRSCGGQAEPCASASAPARGGGRDEHVLPPRRMGRLEWSGAPTAPAAAPPLPLLRPWPPPFLRPNSACAMAASQADKGCSALALSHPPVLPLTSPRIPRDGAPAMPVPRSRAHPCPPESPP